ncbi:hypothetical protein [Paralysiella testudinis]|uniref:Uncharacterized protein n=1 Tax=Paralysiella testudinis TaxID=2809020 RepID=A0A892ZGZ0_9NEIS|nr:hypothetical protein [Paralysiella testudinis]QRQ81097.1 hypothetical protein JQU52_10225 [Paralysiella testudinis]
MKKALFISIVLFTLAACGGESAVKTPAPPPPVKEAQAEKPAHLNMGFGTFRLRANSGFKALDLPYKISAGEWPLAEEGATEKNAIIELDKNLVLALTIDAKSDKITVISPRFTVTKNGAYNLQLGNGALVLLASADGEEMAVIQELNNMMVDAMQEYTDSKDGHVVEKMLDIRGVKYGITIRDKMPVILSASSSKS